VISDPTQVLYAQSLTFWAGLRSLVKIVTERQVGDTITQETRYYISSLAGNARQVLHAVRSHWCIENELHWSLDVTLGEDDSCVRKDHAPENLATLRRLVLSLLKQERSAKCGLRQAAHGGLEWGLPAQGARCLDAIALVLDPI
jgi:predicted transposase YbfD/YdcC